MLFSWWLNGSDSAVFRNNDFGEIKDDNLKKTFFQKKIGYWSFRYVSTLCKKVFSRAQVKSFCLYGSVSQILFFSGMWLLERSKITLWERFLFKKKFQCKLWDCVYIMWKGIFKRTSEELFHLWFKLLRFPSFWECRFWGYQRSQFENEIFWKNIYYGCFRYVSILRKKGIFRSTSEMLFSLWLK